MNDNDIQILNFDNIVLLYALDDDSCVKINKYKLFFREFISSIWEEDNSYLFFDKNYITGITNQEQIIDNWSLAHSKLLTLNDELITKLFFITESSHNIRVYFIYLPPHYNFKKIILSAINQNKTLLNLSKLFKVTCLISEYEYIWIKAIINSEGLVLSKDSDGSSVVIYGNKESIQNHAPKWPNLIDHWNKLGTN